MTVLFLYYNVFMKNPMKKFKTIKKACEVLDFDVAIPSRYIPREIYTIDSKVLELRFASIIARKSKYINDLGDKGISGVYSGAYPKDSFKGDFEIDGIKGIEFWNGSSKSPKCYLATWNDIEHKYSYSVYSPKGIKLKTMSRWIKLFK